MSKTTQTMMLNLTTLNWIQGTNKYRLNFSQPLDLRNVNAKLMMYQYSVYNSTYNISKALENNTYSIKWINGQIYNFTIPDGYYSFDDLDTNLQYNLAQNKLYFQNTTDTNKVLYYIKFSANTVLYKSQIDINFVPSTLPSGFTIPSGASWTMPIQSTYPQITLSKGLMTLFGFTKTATIPINQTVPSPNINASFLSDIAPRLSPTFSYYLTCNFVETKVSNVPNIFFQIPINAGYGKLISQTVGNSGTGLSVMKTIYNFMEITFLDNNYNTNVFNDPDIAISVILQIEEQ